MQQGARSTLQGLGLPLAGLGYLHTAGRTTIAQLATCLACSRVSLHQVAPLFGRTAQWLAVQHAAAAGTHNPPSDDDVFPSHKCTRAYLAGQEPQGAAGMLLKRHLRWYSRCASRPDQCSASQRCVGGGSIKRIRRLGVGRTSNATRVDWETET